MILRLENAVLKRTQLLLTVMLFFFCQLAWTQSDDAIGTVLTASGQITAESSGDKRTLKRRDSVYAGDTISTGSKSRVRFKLLDDSTYVIQENSRFTIEEYNYNGSEDGSEVADFYFSEGVMEFVSGYIGKQDQAKFRIDTDFAVIGLRGSGGIITTDSSSTQVFVTLGQLTAVSKDGQLFLMNNGQTTVLDGEGETSTEQGNGTGAEQTMTTDGNDITAEEGDAEDQGQQSEEEQSEDDKQQNQDEEVAATDPDNEEENTDQGSNSTDGSQVTDAQLSAAEIYAELLPADIDATQEDLAQALNEAVEAYPVLYEEFVYVAIDAGLEPPRAAVEVADALGGVNSVSENALVRIFDAATDSITDSALVDAALADEGYSPLLTDNPIGVVSPDIRPDLIPENDATSVAASASPAN